MRITFIIAIIMAFAGCTDKLIYNDLSGIYEGNFDYVSPLDGNRTSAKTRMTFSDENFSAGGNANRIPAGGSGTFTIQKENFIIFTDKNIWTADFDWKLILNGKYSYEVKNDSLILNRYSEPCPNCSSAYSLYQYRLKRIN